MGFFSVIHIMNGLKHQSLNCLRRKEDISSITQHLPTCSLHVKKNFMHSILLMRTLDLKAVPFLVSRRPEFMAATAEDESGQRNRMRINALALHCSSAFLYLFSDHSLTFLTFLSIQLGKCLCFFCQSRL